MKIKDNRLIFTDVAEALAMMLSIQKAIAKKVKDEVAQHPNDARIFLQSFYVGQAAGFTTKQITNQLENLFRADLPEKRDKRKDSRILREQAKEYIENLRIPIDITID